MGIFSNDFQSKISPPMLFWHADFVSLKAEESEKGSGYITLCRKATGTAGGSSPIKLTVRAELTEKPGFWKKLVAFFTGAQFIRASISEGFLGASTREVWYQTNKSHMRQAVCQKLESNEEDAFMASLAYKFIPFFKTHRLFYSVLGQMNEPEKKQS